MFFLQNFVKYLTLYLLFFFYLTNSESITEEALLFPRNNLHLLHVAAFYDSFECFLYIFNKGFDANVKSPNDFCPIHYACYGGAIEVVSFLCSPGIIELKDLTFAPMNSQFSPIYLATVSKSPQILELLFESGVSIDQKTLTSHKSTPIGQAIRCRDFDCLVILLNHINPQKIDERNFSPVMKAISSNFPEAVRILVDHGADVLYTTSEGKNALYLACFVKNEELVKYLLENGADPTVSGYLGQYPIHWAASSDNINIVNLILNYGADPNVFDNRGRPPTFSALNSNDNKDQILKVLLDAGCDPNAKNRVTGTTILASLMVMDETPVVLNSIKIVLEKGGDLNYVMKNKKTIYQTAKAVSKPEVLKVIDNFISDHPEIHVK